MDKIEQQTLSTQQLQAIAFCGIIKDKLFVGCTITNATGFIFQNCSFRQTSIDGGICLLCKFTDLAQPIAERQSSVIKNAEIIQTPIIKAVVDNSNLFKVNAQYCELNNSTVSISKLSFGSSKDSHIERSSFNNMTIKGGQLYKADAHKQNIIENACLKRININKCHETTLSNCYLEYVNSGNGNLIKDSYVAHSNIDNASLLNVTQLQQALPQNKALALLNNPLHARDSNSCRKPQKKPTLAELYGRR